MFDVHWSSAGEDITYFIYHVTSQEHTIEGSFDVLGQSSSLYITMFSLKSAINVYF